MYPGTGLEPIYWAQSSNPLLNDKDEVENYYPIDVPYYKINNFSGLTSIESDKYLLSCSSQPNYEDV